MKKGIPIWFYSTKIHLLPPRNCMDVWYHKIHGLEKWRIGPLFSVFLILFLFSPFTVSSHFFNTFWHIRPLRFPQAGIEWVLIEIFSGVASVYWAFSTKFWLFLGGPGLFNETPLKISRRTHSILVWFPPSFFTEWVSVFGNSKAICEIMSPLLSCAFLVSS